MNKYDDMQELRHPDRGTATADNSDLIPGELYTFYSQDYPNSADTPVWGVFDKIVGGQIYLESSSTDFTHFEMWHALPDNYRHCLLATRDELRDYTAALTLWECRKFSGR